MSKFTFGDFWYPPFLLEKSGFVDLKQILIYHSAMEIFRYSLTASVIDSKGMVYMSTEGKNGVEVAASLADKLSEHTLEMGEICQKEPKSH